MRVAILISGRGSNMVALIEAAADPAFPAEIALVLSNRPEAAGLARAAAAGIATKVIDHKAYASREEFEAALDQYLRSMDVEIVALAGFMRVLTAGFIAGWEGRMINIHPSLLPAYKGLHTHERVLADGGTEHGCTVHHVTAELDAGPIILQAKVPVMPGDTPESLAARVLKEEHRIYPQALAMPDRFGWCCLRCLTLRGINMSGLRRWRGRRGSVGGRRCGSGVRALGVARAPVAVAAPALTTSAARRAGALQTGLPPRPA